MPKQITMVKWSAKDIPYGVAFDENTGTFSGSPLNAGDYVVPVTVQTNYGTDTKDVALNIEDLKDYWQIIPLNVQENISYIYNCIDNGQEIIFFADVNAVGGNGVFFTYNYKTKTFSEIYRLMDGEKYSKGSSASGKCHLCIQDPITKKWIAFFGRRYLRTSSGIVKDLGSDVDFVSSTGCWSNKLQKFCVIEQKGYTNTSSSRQLASYLFDIDGNLLEKSTNINSLNRQFQSSAGGMFTEKICWSDTENKFILVSSNYVSTSQNFLAYSSDGINWTEIKLNTIIGSSAYPRMIIRIESLGLFILLTSDKSIYTSPDGLTWEKIKTFDDSEINYGCYHLVWSESKKTLCCTAHDTRVPHIHSYTTSDFINWTKQYGETGAAFTENANVIWSDTSNAFIGTTCSKYIYTAKI